MCACLCVCMCVFACLRACVCMIYEHGIKLPSASGPLTPSILFFTANSFHYKVQGKQKLTQWQFLSKNICKTFNPKYLNYTI